MSWPNIDQNTQDRPRPLKYAVGAEIAKTVVIYSSTVELDDDSRRLVPGGTLLTKITSGTGSDKYGPYSGTATDGRQTVDTGTVCITQRGHDVTLGDKAVEGLYAMCVFDKSELTTGGYALHGISLGALEAALPSCVFDD